MVSIHRPLGYGPSTLPLRHAALLTDIARYLDKYPNEDSCTMSCEEKRCAQ